MQDNNDLGLQLLEDWLFYHPSSTKLHLELACWLRPSQLLTVDKLRDKYRKGHSNRRKRVQKHAITSYTEQDVHLELVALCGVLLCNKVTKKDNEKFSQDTIQEIFQAPPFDKHSFDETSIEFLNNGIRVWNQEFNDGDSIEELDIQQSEESHQNLPTEPPTETEQQNGEHLEEIDTQHSEEEPHNLSTLSSIETEQQNDTVRSNQFVKDVKVPSFIWLGIILFIGYVVYTVIDVAPVRLVMQTSPVEVSVSDTVEPTLLTVQGLNQDNQTVTWHSTTCQKRDDEGNFTLPCLKTAKDGNETVYTYTTINWWFKGEVKVCVKRGVVENIEPICNRFDLADKMFDGETFQLSFRED